MFIASSLSSDTSLAIPQWVFISSAVMLGLALIFSFIRFFLGPKTPDRIVAFDLLAGVTMAALLLSGVISGSGFYLQIVLGFSLVLFLGTVAMAKYLDQPSK